MSPKKIVKNLSLKRKNIETTPKRTVKKEKPKLNMPANLKVSIPLTRSTEEGIHVPIIRGRCPPRFKTKLDIQTKIELSNSVARQQLIKEEIPIPSLGPDNVVLINLPKKGRKCNKKVVSEFFESCDIAENVVTSTKMSSKDNSKKKPTLEKKPPPKQKIVSSKRLADSTAQAAKRPKLQLTAEAEALKANVKFEDNLQTREIPVEPDINLITDPPPAVVLPAPTAKRTRSTIKRPQPSAKKLPIKQGVLRKREPRGKRQTVAVDNVSPSILDQLRKLSKNDTETEVQIKLNPPKTPGPVDSRKTSVSSNSNLSWTKDISSSSTTTCITVCSNDFVRFNKKLPILKLTNIDNELKRRQNDVRQLAPSAEVIEIDKDSSDSSDSDSSTSENSFSEQLRGSIDVNSLHLSASSPVSNFSQSRTKDTIPDYAKAADKLSLTIEKLDMEIINWISSENDDVVNANLEKFRDKMFDILDNEFGVITHCRRLKEILEPPKLEDVIDERTISEQAPEKIPDSNNDKEIAPAEEPVKEPEFVKPIPCRKLSGTSEGHLTNGGNKVTRDENPERDMMEMYNHHDDDDALSLFAESITGFESVRMNSSIPSVAVFNTRQIEEYVPKPVKEDSVRNTEKPTYCPTKIHEETAEMLASKIKTICEKQNADSTSIYKQSNSTDDAESYQDINENGDLDTRIGPPDVIKKPQLMDSFFEGTPKARSLVFGSLCFYNLLNCCRKVYFGQCRFVHLIPTNEQIKGKLNLLDERMLIQEYLLLRKWVELRRKYGLCYVEECAKRGLTRILVEMAYDSIVKARNGSEEDTQLRVSTIELTLLHLNSVDLSICEDLLKMSIHPDKGNRTLLCDVFMATMSITQNFSRFKVVFLTLTYFMVDNDRTFNKDVVEHILERVCILPFEEATAKALIQMMRLTNSDIFKNSMIGHFEKQISASKDIFEEYTLLKNQCAFKSMLASSMMSVSPPTTADQPLSVRPDASDGQPPALSPDTTNLDKMNKTADETPQPVITRTIGMNPPLIVNRDPTRSGRLPVQDSSGQSRYHESSGPSRVHERSGPSRVHDISGPSRVHESPGPSRVHDSTRPSRVHTSSGSSTSEEKVIMNVKKWRNRSIFSHIQTTPTPTRPPMRPPMRPPQRMPFNQRLVTFRSPSNFTRKPAPKY